MLPFLKPQSLPGVRALLGVLTLASSAFGDTTGWNSSHDPSRIVESEGRFYVFSTAADVKSSADGLDWTREPSIIPNGFPAWVHELLPNGNQGVWAPGIIEYNDQFLLYFSVCGVPASGAPCAIGLLTTPTLNSSSPDYAWTDRGMVLSNPQNSDAVQYATIDAAPIIDTNGDLWLVWGSGYGKDPSRDQLYITRLDNATGLPLTSDPAYDPPASPGHPLKTGIREGPYMHYRNGYYYLFWNEGSCCDGTASTYTIWVSRSTAITGPFTDDRIFYASTGDIHGPGHMGIYSACGVQRFTYHYYPTSASILGENELLWNDDGWPEVGPESTTPPCHRLTNR